MIATQALRLAFHQFSLRRSRPLHMIPCRFSQATDEPIQIPPPANRKWRGGSSNKEFEGDGVRSGTRKNKRREHAGEFGPIHKHGASFKSLCGHGLARRAKLM
jgi:hypothetical protein